MSQANKGQMESPVWCLPLHERQENMSSWSPTEIDSPPSYLGDSMGMIGSRGAVMRRGRP